MIKVKKSIKNDKVQTDLNDKLQTHDNPNIIIQQLDKIKEINSRILLNLEKGLSTNNI